MRVLIVLLVFSTYIFGQVEQSRRASVYNIGPSFYLDIANYKSDENEKTKVDVFIQVPYSNLQFIRADKQYKASYSVTLTFYDEDKDNIVFEKIWTERVKVSEFDNTIGKSGYNLSYRSSNLVPGEYYLKCMVEDLDSKRSAAIEKMVNIKDFNEPIMLSDIVLVLKRFEGAKKENIIPNVSKFVTTEVKDLDFFYEVYSADSNFVFVKYMIEDFKGNQVFNKLQEYQLNKKSQVINFVIQDPNFLLGDYTLIVEMHDDENNVLDVVKKELHSKIIGFPVVIKNLDLAIEQMTYIATSNDIDTIDSGKTYEEKLDEFIKYWKAKDPSPNTTENEVLAEYYRRVSYANKNFKNYFDGWRTDMGMIYITLGPPNQVDRHPFDYDSRPYEVWDYFELNRRFVFIDQTGFGDYRLQNPVYGDWYRYRY